MLSFILSKMNMLIFATAVFIIALMMLSFTSNIELKNVTASNLNLSAQIIEEQLNTTALHSYKATTIPDVLRYGLNNRSMLFYELKFSKIKEGDYTTLILSINQKGKTNIIDARKIITKAEVILIDPEFIAKDDEPISNYYKSNDKEIINLYPRAELQGDQIVAPNAFIALKRTINEKEMMYIIPCSNSKNDVYATNCVSNILRIGCYELKKENGNLLSTAMIHEAFDITRQVLEDQTRVSNFTGKDCTDNFGTTQIS